MSGDDDHGVGPAPDLSRLLIESPPPEGGAARARDEGTRRRMASRKRALAAVTSVVVLVVIGAGLTLARKDRGTTDVRTITGGDELPASPVPTGWQTLDYGDLRVSVPSNWNVHDAPTCPGSDDSVAVVFGGLTADCPATVVSRPVVTVSSAQADCTESACGERWSNNYIRPDYPIVRLDHRNGMRVAQVDRLSSCEACVNLLLPDVRGLLSFSGVSDADIAGVLATVDRSPRWRALHDGPLLDTSDWQVVDGGPLVPVRLTVPRDWRVQHTRELSPARSPRGCRGGFDGGATDTVFVNETSELPNLGPPTSGYTNCDQETMRLSSPVDAAQLRPSEQDAYDMSGVGGDQTTSDGRTITVLDNIYVESTIELRIEQPGQPAVRVSIGVGPDPVIARTIVHALGRPLSSSPISGAATTATTTPRSTISSLPEPATTNG